MRLFLKTDSLNLANWAGEAGLVCLSALALIFSFPSSDIEVLAWIGLIPWLLVLSNQRPGKAFWLSYLGAWVLFSGIFYWIWTVPAFNILDYLLLASYLGLFGGLFGLTLAWLRMTIKAPLAFLAPPLWVTIEYLRSHISFLGVPWMLLGHSQYQHPVLIQISSLTGVYGLSFLIVLVNASVTDLILYWGARHGNDIKTRQTTNLFPLTSVLMAVLAMTGAWAYGHAVLSHPRSGPSVKIAMIQGNIPQKEKWDPNYRKATLNEYAELTRRAAVDKPDLIIWPETAVPGDVLTDDHLQQNISNLAMETETSLLVGTAVNAKFSKERLPGRTFNSLVLFGPDGRLTGEYRKMQPVPFAEYTPLKNWISWPKIITSSRADILAGDHPSVFRIRGATFAGTICWESIFPELVRRLAQKKIGFLVNATNEAIFGPTAAPYQLLAMTVFRAAEHRIAIARVGNSGVSAFIDPYGRIIDRLRDSNDRDIFVSGSLIHSLQLSNERTFYTRWGDLFIFMQIGFVGVCLIYVALKEVVSRLLIGRQLLEDIK